MNSNKYVMLMILAAAMMPMSSHAADGLGTATATVVEPITITPVTDLAFGKLDAKTGGTVVVDTANGRTAGGSVVLVNTGSTTTSASFDIAGEANATYAITLPSAPVTITDGVESMNVDTFTSNPAATGTLDGTGAQSVSVGATLNVASGQAPGSYSGTFTVTVEYN